MNRSAKDGARSTGTMTAKAFLPTRRTSERQRKIGRQEGSVFRLAPITDPISREAKWERMHGEQSDIRILPEAREAG